MSVISSFLAVLCSAVLLSLGISNEYLHFGSALFGIIALIPLYTAFCISPTRRRTAWMFGAMIALVHLCSSFWLAYFENFAIFTLGASTVAYFFLGFLFGYWFYYAMKLPLRLRPFAFACLWTLWEWFKGSGFVAYPWGSLSMTALSLRPLIQIADITGVWGITRRFFQAARQTAAPSADLYSRFTAAGQRIRIFSHVPKKNAAAKPQSCVSAAKHRPVGFRSRSVF